MIFHSHGTEKNGYQKYVVIIGGTEFPQYYFSNLSEFSGIWKFFGQWPSSMFSIMASGIYLIRHSPFDYLIMEILTPSPIAVH